MKWKKADYEIKTAQIIESIDSKKLCVGVKRIYGVVPDHIPDEQVSKYLSMKYGKVDEGKNTITISFNYGLASQNTPSSE